MATKRSIDSLNLVGLLTVALFMLLAMGMMASFSSPQPPPSGAQANPIGESVTCQDVPRC